MRYVLAGLLAVVASAISAETIEIRTVADLQSVTNNLGATYELMNDIDLSGVSFEPIGGVDRLGAKEFTGSFHGNGHKIVGLKINDTGSYGYVGFFRATSRATITDLQIVGEVSGQDKYCGGLVGRSVGSYFSNCVVQVSISGGQYTGGFVGDDSGSRYVRCVARGTLQIASMYCGGFVGRASGEYWQCVSSMVASAPNGNGGYVEYGGFVGVNSGATFQDCAATGSLTVKNNNYFGGFVGCAEKGNYYDCYSAVDITLRKGGRTGGFVGALGGEDNLFTRCYVCGTFKWGSGAYDIGGFLGDALGQDATSFSKWIQIR